MKSRILVVDDDLFNLKATSALLEDWNYKVDIASSGLAAIEMIKNADKDYAVVLMDYKMPDLNGAETALKIREINKETVILMYSCDGSREALKNAFRAGAVDFIDKDENLESLKSAIEIACQHYEESLSIHKPIVNKAYNSDLLRSIGMVGQSQKMAEVAQRCLNYRKYDQPVLILGETGSGKELVAKAVHGPDLNTFFAINCASFTDSNLIESELFGYEKGAFTGAVNRKSGILENAGKGTVFLDELHHLSPKGQASLLRAIREKKIRRVGGSNEIDISCRIIAASKPDLIKFVDQGTFLPDLYYRLKFLTIEVPALRERPEDIGLLAEMFAKHFNERTGKKITFRSRVIRLFEKYSWPGNVGELDGCVSDLFVNSKTGIISTTDLKEHFTKLDILENPNTTLADLNLKHQEEIKQLVSRTLQTSDSRRRAALRLGVHEATFRGIVEKLGLVDLGQ